MPGPRSMPGAKQAGEQHSHPLARFVSGSPRTDNRFGHSLMAYVITDNLTGLICKLAHSATFVQQAADQAASRGQERTTLPAGAPAWRPPRPGSTSSAPQIFHTRMRVLWPEIWQSCSHFSSVEHSCNCINYSQSNSRNAAWWLRTNCAFCTKNERRHT